MATGTDGISVPDMAQDIVSRSETLLQEMEHLRQRYHAARGAHQNIPGLANLLDAVRQEHKSAQAFLAPQAGGGPQTATPGPDDDDDDGDDDLTGPVAAAAPTHPAGARLRFTNLPAVERNWNIVKRCCDIVSLEQSVPRVPRLGVKEDGGLVVVAAQHRRGGGGAADMAFVHAVVDGGAEWLRVVSKDEKRVLMELAGGGWDWEWEDSGGEGERGGEIGEEEDDDDDDAELFEDVPLLRTAKELVDTARRYWHEYRRPRIRILLTRIEEGRSKDVDRVVRKMRRAGGGDISVTVDCVNSAWLSGEHSLGIDEAVMNLVPAGFDRLGATVLLDTSVLIAMASDISHSSVEIQPWHSIDCKTQARDEANGINFLSLQAYPPLQERQLVCTKEAVQHFNDIIITIGSPTELERARVLFESGPEEFQKLSIHPVPGDLMLPVQVLQEETDLYAQDLVDRGELPAVAVQVQKHLLGVSGNRATHLYGWRSGKTVVTSNRSVANKLVRIVENSLDKDYEGGPRIFTLPYNRALSTKGPKRRD